MITDSLHVTRPSLGRRLPRLLLLWAGLLGLARAEDPAPNAMAQLVHILVEQKTLTAEQGQLLLQVSEAEKAAVAKQVEVAVRRALPPGAPAPANAATAPAHGSVLVQYVPEVVKQQLREDIKQDVMQQARAENWAAPHSYPAWIDRFKFSGDLRLRYEGQFYPAGNALNELSNFNAINTGSPYDVSAANLSAEPLYNVDQNRSRLRLRARFGTDIDLSGPFTGGLRLATGDTNSPVTANQTFGQSGGFTKYAIWLDRAFVNYDAGLSPTQQLDFTAGRFENPFLATNLLWADDLGFDGAMARGRFRLGSVLTPFFTAGVFPIFNTDLNFASNQPSKLKSEDKWLYAVQLGTGVKLGEDVRFKLGAAYYYFDNIQGRLSLPAHLLTSSDPGSTDALRPAFAQKGNTYMALRDIVPDASNGYGTTNQWQYYGLAAPFREVAVTARGSYEHFAPFLLSFEAEAVKNLGFDVHKVNPLAVNNRLPPPSTATAGTLGAYNGGDLGWTFRLEAGHAAMEKRWDWNVSLGYKYVESDAVVDGFTDSDFGLGGTNLKGYTFSASVALAPRVWMRARWMSADQIGGPRFQVDVLQVDMNTKF